MKLGEMPGYLLVAYQGVGDRVAPEHNGATLIAHCDAWSLHRDIAAPMDGVIVVIVFNIWGSKVLLQFSRVHITAVKALKKRWIEKLCYSPVHFRNMPWNIQMCFRCCPRLSAFSTSVQLCIPVWYLHIIGTIYVSGTINMHINSTYKLLAPWYPA